MAGVCGIICNPGFANCDSNLINGCERSVSADPLNCGACGTTCASGVCTAGACASVIPPIIDLVYGETPAHVVVTGVEVRVASVAAPNNVGSWVRNPCLPSGVPGGSPAGTCRIDLRQLTQPGSSMLITAWNSNWGFEIRPLTSSGYLCGPSDATCGGAWNSTTQTFTGLTVNCATAGAGTPYSVLYTDSYPPNGGLAYNLHVGLNDTGQPLLCRGM